MHQLRIYIAFALLLPLAACEKLPMGETVETANILWPAKDMPYRFSRNGVSSVDYYEANLIANDFNDLSRMVERADLTSSSSYSSFMNLYENGLSVYEPEQQLGNSATVAQREVQKCFRAFIEQCRNAQKDSEARAGRAGSIGRQSFGLTKTYYVNAKGLVYGEVFTGMLDGALYLDKILHFYLSNQHFENQELQQDQTNLVLINSANYTQLEHDWDMAYGYYQLVKGLVDANGNPELKRSALTLENAFVYGRYSLGLYDYETVIAQMGIIRAELSKAFAINLIDRLEGKITLLNYKEEPQQAFSFLSRAYGMLYSLQFTAQTNGAPYFTPEEAKTLQEALTQGDGLWEQERLLAAVDTPNSLAWIAQQIRSKFNLQ